MNASSASAKSCAFPCPSCEGFHCDKCRSNPLDKEGVPVVYPKALHPRKTDLYKEMYPDADVPFGDLAEDDERRLKVDEAFKAEHAALKLHIEKFQEKRKDAFEAEVQKRAARKRKRASPITMAVPSTEDSSVPSSVPPESSMGPSTFAPPASVPSVDAPAPKNMSGSRSNARSIDTLPSFTATAPAYSPTLPSFTATSPAYSPAFTATSPAYSPTLPAFTETSPKRVRQADRVKEYVVGITDVLLSLPEHTRAQLLDVLMQQWKSNTDSTSFVTELDSILDTV
jgi:hypothetical protein